MEWGANPRAAGTVSVRPYRSALWARGRKSVTVGSHGKADVDAEGFYLRDRESGDLHIFEKRSLTAKGERSARIKTDAPVSLRWEAGAFFYLFGTNGKPARARRKFISFKRVRIGVKGAVSRIVFVLCGGVKR